jgi:hypothetical protein
VIATRLRLKTGANPTASAKQLADLIMLGGNVSSVGGGPEAIVRMRDEYLNWIEQVESRLRELTHDTAPISELFTPHYWRIRSLETDPRLVSDPRPYPLVYSEVRRQQDWLQVLLDDLNSRLSRLSAAGGHLTVLDTHVLLHYQPPGQIPWPSIVRHEKVRLVIPLRVIEEIDAKKYAKGAELAKRARNLLPQLERVLGPAGAPGRLNDAVTIEVPVDTGPRYRPDDADEEILDACRELSQFTSKPITLMTGDTAMRLRAQANAIPTKSLPDNYRRTTVE